jgi:hypothetical protein
MIQMPAGLLGRLRSRATPPRRAWERFVAVRISALEALPMDPVILPEAIALIDRHYDSLAAYKPSRPAIFAINRDGRLVLRYADYLSRRLVLRPHNLSYPVELLEIEPEESPRRLIAGRVALILNET